ncbi:MAG: vacuolar iron transporter family protein [Candidatus Binataceae bacterium]|nr:vacuolar iron transporter family protein [Candidatus Binataceae bacterium]
MAALKTEEKRRTFERLANIREIVFGVQDGVLTTAGVLAGLSGAVEVRSQVILAALASTVAGALSMGAGAYLGAHAESAVLRSELERVRRESQEQPYVIQESLIETLGKEGLSREAAYRVVKLMSESPDVLYTTAEEKLYGLTGANFGNPINEGLLMGVAFLIGALVPLLPFMLIASVHVGLIAGLATTAIVLFAVGYIFEGRFSGERRPALAGLRFLAIALSAAIIGYVVGLLIAPIGTVPVG